MSLAMPPMRDTPAAPLERVPSLELVESDNAATESSQPSNQDLMQAMIAFHESVMGKLGTMERRFDGLEHLAEQRARRHSISSATSALRPSASGKKHQVPNGNLAMQALEMDISSLMPHTFKASDSGTTSMGVGSWKLGRKKQKEKTKKGVGEEKGRESGKPGLSVLPSDHPRSHPNQVAEGSSPRTSPGPGPELPALVLGGLDESGSEDARATGTPQRVDTEKSDVKASGSMPTLPASPSSPRPRVQSVKSFTSGEEKSGSKTNSIRSRRSSVSLNRAVSKANITEVFKVREQELTADLQKTRFGLSDKKKVASVVSIDEGAPAEASDSDSSEEVLEKVEEEDEEVETDLVDPESFWLKLSPLNTFITCYVSKALGLVPLFDPVIVDDEMTWKGCLKQMVSRLYHWSVILVLLYFLIDCVWTLGICHMSDDFGEEVCNSTWPPLAVDMVLLTGAILVLTSWGGLLRYTDTTKLVAQSAAELEFYSTQRGLAGAWKTWSCKDALWTLLFWFILVPARYIPSAWNCIKEGNNFAEWQDVPRFFSHGLLTGILVVASFWQVRTSHAMLLILNSWIASLLGGESSCLEAKQQWRRVSGLFRKTSRTFEHCFAALASLIVGLAISSLYDLRQGRGLEVVCGAAAVVFILPGVLWTHASTTTACNRLPSLVTLCEAEDEDEEEEYMSLAMYLSLSECGFFVWDTCVSVAFVQKFLYFAMALAGTIGFQTGALKLS